MSDSESYPKPSDEPDFSSLAEQVEEPTQTWQFAAESTDTESNRGLAYTVDQKFEAQRASRIGLTDHFTQGVLFLTVGLVLSLNGVIIFTGAIGYGIYQLYKAFTSSRSSPSMEKRLKYMPALAPVEIFIVRPESPADQAAIHALHAHALGQQAEAKLVDELRAEGCATLSLVAVAGVRIVGHVLFSPIEIVSEVQSVRALALAPLGVVPGWQRQGVGSALVREGLKQAAELGERIVIVLGDPGYYRRFGFQPELAAALQSPYAGEHFMALELSPGALEGVTGEVRYPAPFSRLG